MSIKEEVGQRDELQLILKNQKESKYVRCFEMIVEKCFEMRIYFQPKSIIIDFEKAIHDACIKPNLL